MTPLRPELIQFREDVGGTPQEKLAKVEKLENEIIQELHNKPLAQQKIERVGAIFAMAIGVGIAYILEGVRTLGGLRDKFSVGADTMFFRHLWNSQPLPPDAAAKIADKFNELDRIFRNNKSPYAPPSSRDINTIFGEQRVKIYEELSQYRVTKDYWSSIANGGGHMQKIREDIQKLEELHKKENKKD